MVDKVKDTPKKEKKEEGKKQDKTKKQEKGLQKTQIAVSSFSDEESLLNVLSAVASEESISIAAVGKPSQEASQLESIAETSPFTNREDYLKRYKDVSQELYHHDTPITYYSQYASESAPSYASAIVASTSGGRAPHKVKLSVADKPMTVEEEVE